MSKPVLPLLVAACIAGITLSHPAQAQPAAAAAANDPAQLLYQRGNDAYDAGKFQEAYDLYKQAYDIRKSYEVAGNLGQAAHKLGKLAEAAEYLRYSLSIYPTNGNAERRARQEALLAEVERGIGVLAIQSNVRDATLIIDGRTIGELPIKEKVYLQPGEHVLRLQRDGYLPVEQRVTAVAGSTLAVTLELLPDGGGDKSLALILTGSIAAAAFIGVGTGLGIISLGAASDRDELRDGLSGSNPCGDGTPHTADCSEIESLDSDASTFGAIAITGVSVGGALAISTLLYVLIPSSSSGSAEPSPAKTSLTVLPVLGPDQGGLFLQGTF